MATVACLSSGCRRGTHYGSLFLAEGQLRQIDREILDAFRTGRPDAVLPWLPQIVTYGASDDWGMTLDLTRQKEAFLHGETFLNAFLFDGAKARKLKSYAGDLHYYAFTEALSKSGKLTITQPIDVEQIIGGRPTGKTVSSRHFTLVVYGPPRGACSFSIDCRSGQECYLDNLYVQ